MFSVVRPFSSSHIPKLAARQISQRTFLRQGFAHFNSTSTKSRRFRVSYFWYGLCLAFGASAGYAVSSFAAPSPLPVPGSREDQLALEALALDIDSLEIVKALRAEGYHLHADTPLNEIGKGHRGWMELDVKRNMTEAALDKERPSRTLTMESMAGAQGLGVQRVFWNSETRELVAVVWMGAALSGWPGLAHGGAIAIVFKDAMLRLVAGPNVPVDSIPPPSFMSVTYARPTPILNYYILRASFSTPDIPQQAPAPKPTPVGKSTTSGPAPAVEVSATLETLEGKVCVRAKGTFPRSGGP
ncbi:uncharacterized protein BDR25DRAFT_238390 [Lindgomyces ingoldianus]|uniref:Uncharacterized protein n=1 Tax=Lindgomyces ingoldianus TaxID=673940 RepID=A0ACB6QG82_9PLEO|nr:uncharacterized protein BDR25DRAFT_238390 [Lindgomyces ingoldianus]KAF2465931.1 hypothetical protein BDR25DRAFT_238390 [Lindgomyces ingoldianus]